MHLLENSNSEDDLQSIIVAARISPLSQIQYKEVLEALRLYHPDVYFMPYFLQTCGDRDQETSLKEMDKTDFFTRDIDQLQLQGTVRLSIHSAKDLPEPLPPGLTMVALTHGVDSANSLVMAPHLSFETLPPHARIGTSSLLREHVLQQMRPDLRCVDIRGNIGQRLEKLQTGQVEGVVIAEAALIRLGLTHLNRIRLPGHVAQYQGQLAVLARVEDEEMMKLFACLDIRKKNMKKILYFGLDPHQYLSRGMVTHYPLIQVLPRFSSMPDIQKALCDVHAFTHFIFTSQNGVEIFFEQAHSVGIDCIELKQKTFIVVGKKTAFALEQQGVVSVITAAEETAEGVVDTLQKLDMHGAYVLWPHAALSRKLIAEYLHKSHIRYHQCVLYDTVSHYVEPPPNLSQFDTLVFTSPSVVDSFFQMFPSLPESKEIITIGPVTHAHLEKKIGRRIIKT